MGKKDQRWHQDFGGGGEVGSEWWADLTPKWVSWEGSWICKQERVPFGGDCDSGAEHSAAESPTGDTYISVMKMGHSGVGHGQSQGVRG